jgi:hypothetical protein
MQQPGATTWNRKREAGEKPVTAAEVVEMKRQARVEDRNSAILPLACADLVRAQKAPSEENAWLVWGGKKHVGANMRVKIIIDQSIADPTEAKHPNKAELDKREYIVHDWSMAKDNGLRVIINRSRAHRDVPPTDNKCVLNYYNDYWNEHLGYAGNMEAFAITSNLDRRLPEEDGEEEDPANEVMKDVNYVCLIGRPIIFEKTTAVKLIVYYVQASTKKEYEFHKAMCKLAKQTV